MRVGIAQTNSQSDKEKNLAAAESLIDLLALEKGADLIVLPEYFNFIGPEELWPENAEKLADSPSLERMRQKAIAHGVHIHCGTIMEKSEQAIYNTAVVFNPQGQRVAEYRKIHLFDVEVPGGRRYFESETITPGDEVVVFTIGDITFGLATCYDLRFPELFRALSARGAQVVLLPAAFTMMTGKDHWELLLRARAVENLCYVAAAGQCGVCPPKNHSYGRSMIVDPWGIVVSQAGDEAAAIAADIDMDHLQKIRTTFPALDHIRKDIWKHSFRFI